MNVDLCMAVYGVAVAGAAPYLLARQPAVDGVPRLGIAAWLLAGLSVLAAWLAAGVSLVYHPGPIAQAAGATIVGALSARIAYACVVTWRATKSSRERHALAAVVLGRQDPATGAVIIDSAERAVYCMPQAGGGVVVLTTGARDALTARELDAVLTHERAHLEGRHHFLIALGQVLARTVPALALFRELGRRVPHLLEMRADDRAARVYGADTVATAILLMSSPHTPSGVLGLGGPAASVRALRLLGRGSTEWPGRIGVAATAVMLAAGPFLVALPTCPHPW